MSRRDSRQIDPHEDYGFFGPDSVTWKVWGYATSVTVGFQRSVVVEELDPALIAAVDKTQGIYARPRTRYDRTLRYFALVVLHPCHCSCRVSSANPRALRSRMGSRSTSGELSAALLIRCQVAHLFDDDA